MRFPTTGKTCEDSECFFLSMHFPCGLLGSYGPGYGDIVQGLEHGPYSVQHPCLPGKPRACVAELPTVGRYLYVYIYIYIYLSIYLSCIYIYIYALYIYI